LKSGNHLKKMPANYGIYPGADRIHNSPDQYCEDFV